MKSQHAALAAAVIATVAMASLAAVVAAPIQLKPDTRVWTAAPPSVPPGARVALLEGDPKSDSIFTMRISLPSHYLIPLHTHVRDERMTVLSGVVYVGIGDAVDRTKETRFGYGSYYVTPSETRHWVRTGDEGAVLQSTNTGPWSVDYVHPEDDPRNGAKEKK